MELLVFEIAGTLCGVRTDFVSEVQRAVSLSGVAKPGRHVLGAMNLRGQMLLVLDLRVPIGAEPKPMTPGDHLVVLQCGQQLLAVRVDRARELVHIDEGLMTDATAVVPTAHFVECIARMGNEFVHVIDPARLCALAASAS